MIRFALHLRQTSLQAYKLLLEKIALPFRSLLNKIQQGGVDSLKVMKVLREKGGILTNLILMVDEMYLQKQLRIKSENTSMSMKRVICLKEWLLLWL